jgi:uncharacterized surface protein with fasciclin (FAS1) repeats
MISKQLMIALVLTGLVISTASANTKNDNLYNETMEINTITVVPTEMINEDPTIVGVAVANENFSTLVAAVKAAGLVETLNGNGPFTVFAPVNEAFNNLPDGTVANLLKPDNKKALVGLLTYHVVAGKFMAADVVKAISDNNGKFSIPTVQGGVLIASINKDNVILTDEKGNISTIILTDVAASNGVIHAINNVVMPN